LNPEPLASEFQAVGYKAQALSDAAAEDRGSEDSATILLVLSSTNFLRLGWASWPTFPAGCFATSAG